MKEKLGIICDKLIYVCSAIVIIGGGLQEAGIFQIFGAHGMKVSMVLAVIVGVASKVFNIATGYTGKTVADAK